MLGFVLHWKCRGRQKIFRLTILTKTVYFNSSSQPEDSWASQKSCKSLRAWIDALSAMLEIVLPGPSPRLSQTGIAPAPDPGVLRAFLAPEVRFGACEIGGVCHDGKGLEGSRTAPRRPNLRPVYEAKQLTKGRRPRQNQAQGSTVRPADHPRGQADTDQVTQADFHFDDEFHHQSGAVDFFQRRARLCLRFRRSLSCKFSRSSRQRRMCRRRIMIRIRAAPYPTTVNSRRISERTGKQCSP